MEEHEKMNRMYNEEEYITILNKITAKELKTPRFCVPDITKEWEEEFEDELYLTVEGIILRKKSIAHLIRNYNLYGKIKIKARKGKIVIERIEE